MTRSTSDAPGIRRPTASAVPPLAYRGRRWCFVSVPSPAVWSLCSWVSSTPSTSQGDSSSSRSPAVMRLAEIPASTSRCTPPPLTSRQFPSEPLANICTVNNLCILSVKKTSAARGRRVCRGLSQRTYFRNRFILRVSLRRSRRARPQWRCPHPQPAAYPPDPHSLSRYTGCGSAPWCRGQPDRR